MTNVSMTVNGKAVNWSYLEDRDRLDIKGVSIQFRKLESRLNE